MIIEKIPIDKINPAAYNPRKDLKPTDKEYKLLEKSINEYGFIEPLIWNKNGGNLIGGHQRLKILKARGDTEVEVSVVELDAIKEKALNVMLNKVGGAWDDDKLSFILGELSALPDFDIELTGFDVDEIASLQPKINSVMSEGALPDPAPETNIKQGDIIELGIHKLLCGDSKDKNEILRLLDGVKVDLLYYDPPYEIEELWGCYIECDKALVFTDNRHVLSALPILSKFKYVYEFVWDTVISWYLNNRPLCRHRSAWLCQNEPDYDDLGAIVDDGKTRTAKKVKTNLGEHVYEPLTDGVRLTTVYQANKAQLPAQYGKPIEWIGPIIAGCGAKNVLDLFGGSGSTLMACDQLNIPSFLVEIDSLKCQNIVNRYNKR